MRNARATLAPLLSCLGLVASMSLGACDKKADDEKPTKDGAEQAAGQAGEPGPDAVKTFLKDQSKKGCEMLPPAMVAKLLAVPEGELQQMKIAGCIYTWKSADKSQTAQASITTIFVHKDAQAARVWFDSATKNKTADELRAELGTVTKAAKDQESIDTEIEKKAVDQMGGVMAGMMPDGGYQYEDVEGVGDAARVLVHDGSLTVLIGNMGFRVSAYRGAAEPRLDMTGIDPRDIQQVTAAAKQADAKWMEQTRDIRKQRAIEVAKAIVAEL